MNRMGWIYAPHAQNALASSMGIMSYMQRMLALNYTANYGNVRTISGTG